jgi:hypothetical protein
MVCVCVNNRAQERVAPVVREERESGGNGAVRYKAEYCTGMLRAYEFNVAFSK